MLSQQKSPQGVFKRLFNFGEAGLLLAALSWGGLGKVGRVSAGLGWAGLGNAN